MKHIILDRDGVINYDSTEYIKSADEWQAIPGSLQAIAQLNKLGYQVFVVTNQSGLARGKFDMESLNAIHNKMHEALAATGGRIEAVLFCPHAPGEDCDCRKPKPGLLKQISRQYDISLNDVLFVGDKLSDIEAAQAAGASPVLVKTGYGQDHIDQGLVADEIPVYDDLASVVAALTKTD